MTTYTVNLTGRQDGKTTITTTEYKFNDGSRWVRTEHRTPRDFGFKYNVRTTVAFWGFEGDVQHRSSVKALNAATADAHELAVAAAPAEAPATRSEKRDAAIARAEAENAFALEMPALNYGVVTQAHADYCAEHGHATYTNGTDVSPRCPRCGATVAQEAPAEEQAQAPAAERDYRTMETYREAWTDEARETVDAVYSALDEAGYVGPVYRGVGLDYQTGSVTAEFNLPNIGTDPTPYLVGITHDGLLIRLAKYVHTGRMVTEPDGHEEPESIWRTVRNMAEDRAGAILAPALKHRPALLRWAAAAGY